MNEIKDKDITQELSDAFNLLDHQKKGYLTLKEVRVAIKAFGVNVSRDELDNAFKNGMLPADTGKNVDRYAFEKLLDHHIAVERGNDNEIKRLFAILDVDKRGKITFENLVKVSKQAGENIDEKDLYDIINEADTDRDNALTYEEFYR